MTNQELLAMYSVLLDSDKLDSMEITKTEGLADILDKYLKPYGIDILGKIMIANISLEAGMFYIKTLLYQYQSENKTDIEILDTLIKGLTSTSRELSINTQKLILSIALFSSWTKEIGLINGKLSNVTKIIAESNMLHPIDKGIGILVFDHKHKTFYMPNSRTTGRTISPYIIFQLSDNRYAIITSERSLIDLRIEDKTLYAKEHEMFLDTLLTQLVYSYIDIAVTKENINKELEVMCDLRVNYDKIISLVALYCGVDERDITIEYSIVNETDARRIYYQYVEDCGIVRIGSEISIGAHVLKNTIKVDVANKLVI